MSTWASSSSIRLTMVMSEPRLRHEIVAARCPAWMNGAFDAAQGAFWIVRPRNSIVGSRPSRKCTFMSSNSKLRPERDITKWWISGRHQFQSNAQHNAASPSSTTSAMRSARKRRGGRAGVDTDPEESRIPPQSTRRAAGHQLANEKHSH